MRAVGFTFPAVLASNAVVAISNLLVNQVASSTYVINVNRYLNQNAVVSVLLILFILPRVLLVNAHVISHASFTIPGLITHDDNGNHVQIGNVIRNRVRNSITNAVGTVISNSIRLAIVSNGISRRLSSGRGRRIRGRSRWPSTTPPSNYTSNHYTNTRRHATNIHIQQQQCRLRRRHLKPTLTNRRLYLQPIINKGSNCFAREPLPQKSTIKTRPILRQAIRKR